MPLAPGVEVFSSCTGYLFYCVVYLVVDRLPPSTRQSDPDRVVGLCLWIPGGFSCQHARRMEDGKDLVYIDRVHPYCSWSVFFFFLDISSLLLPIF